jgi:hypothetical protein
VNVTIRPAPWWHKRTDTFHTEVTTRPPRTHESVAGGHLTLRQLRARAEEIDLKAALHIEHALQSLQSL